MRSYYLFIILLLLAASRVTSQTVELSGIVKDSLQQPLPYANVIAHPQDKAQQLKFSITDEKGQYELSLQSNILYKVTVHFMGYQPYSFNVKSTKNTVKDIVLQEDTNQLGEVVIELPVIVKGDTTTYKTSAFTSGKERKLKQVLKKLPGVEVQKDGQVFVKGKKITKLLVDGKKFFNGGTKLAVENIPANAVDKINVIENYSEIPFLKGLTDTDETAMNIELKEDKKRFVFGNVEAGKGNTSYYNAHSNLFYYSPKTNLNFIGNSNNIGRKVFTLNDYMNFKGGISSVFKRGQFFDRDGLSQFMESEDMFKASHQFGALHFTQAASSVLELSGYAIFSMAKNEYITVQENQYPTFSENIDKTANQQHLLGIANVTIDYLSSVREKWYSNTQYKVADNDNNRTFNSLINDVNRDIGTQRTNRSHFFQQNIEWHKKQSLHHTFSFTANVMLKKNLPTTFWKTNQPILQGLLPIIKQNEYWLHQQKETSKKQLNAVFKHFWVVNNTNHIYTTLGNTYRKDYFMTNDYQQLADGSKNEFGDAGFQNDVHTFQNDLFLGLHYKFRLGKFTFKQGGELHSYHWDIYQKRHQKMMFLPDFMMRAEFLGSRQLDLTYKIENDFPDISRRVHRYYLTSYQTIYKGNQGLQNEWSHSLNVSYSQFRLYKGLNFRVGLYYTKKVKGIRDRVVFSGNDRYLTSEMLDNPKESINLFVNISKKIQKMKYKLYTRISNNQYVQKVNDDFFKNRNQNFSYNASVKTLYDDFPTIEIGCKQKYGAYKSSNVSSKFLTTSPYVDIEYNFLNDFTFLFDYSYSYYQNKSINANNSYQLSNASLEYQEEDSPWSFKAEAHNLFDQKFRQRNQLSSYIISDTKTYILPRIFLVSIGYHL